MYVRVREQVVSGRKERNCGGESSGPGVFAQDRLH